MPWNKDEYPDSMKNLEPRVRHKAIDIANALLKDNYEEGRAISIGIAQAEKWADDHPAGSGDGNDRKNGKSNERSSGDRGRSSGASRSDSADYHVVTHDGDWAVKKEHKDEAVFTSGSKQKAIDHAKELAEEHESTVYVHDENGRIQRTAGTKR